MARLPGHGRGTGRRHRHRQRRRGAARARGIAVTNIRNYCAPAVVQHVFGLVLALTLRLREYDALLAAGAWERSRDFCLLDYPSRELAGKTLGIVGLGNLGLAVAGVAQAFGMRVVAAAREPGAAGPAGIERVPWPELPGQVDVLSLHCPLTPATRHLIGAPEFRKMRRHALLVNTARGGLVDEAALAQALQDGVIGGAGFDVLTTEPPRAGNPLLDLRLPNFILTPHVAWASRDAMQIMADQLIDNIEAFVRGAPRNRVV
jgi:glycerate dehydrogenase